MAAWAPWVREAVIFLDSEGTVRHWKYAGAYADQPAFDREVYEAVRRRWVELVNEERKKS
jgi:hypothetical protein